MFVVGSEGEGDRAAVRAVHEAAFETAVEADLVDALRETDAWLDGLSLVAREDGEVVGHILFTEARVGEAAVLALAPMAVVPERQRGGIGQALVQEGLRRARATSYPAVVVLGHPEYYPRFGFRPAAAQGVTAPFPAPDEAWMMLRLQAGDPPRGEVTYPPPFHQT